MSFVDKIKLKAEIVAEAEPLLSRFQHAGELTECIGRMVNLGDPANGSLAKMNSGVLLATDDANEVTAFAELYTSQMAGLGYIQKDNVRRVAWKDLAGTDKWDYVKQVKDAFIQAQGGVLLITDAFEPAETLEKKMKNFSLLAEICEQIDKAHLPNPGILAGDLQEKAEKPVVILAGSEAAISEARSEHVTSGALDRRFMWNRVGVAR